MNDDQSNASANSGQGVGDDGPHETVESPTNAAPSDLSFRVSGSHKEDEVQASFFEIRQKAKADWSAAQQAKMIDEKSKASDDVRVLNAEEVQFINENWRPLLADFERKSLTERVGQTLERKVLESTTEKFI